MKKTSPPYHFVGIGGIGMSALARICLDKKMKVTGSDQNLTPNTETLIHMGAKVHIGHSPQALPDGATVVYSSGIPEDNPELLAAKKKNLPLLHRSDFLAKLMSGAKALAVAGTHGKTTVSALLTSVLVECQWSPTFALGGMLARDQRNGGAGVGEYFVAEADESDGSFVKYHPFGAILTNIDQEHVQCYGSQNALLGAFSTFVQQVSSARHLLYCADDTHLPSLIADGGVSYGFSPEADCQITQFGQKGWGICFDLAFDGKIFRGITLPMLGAFNALNATAVFALCIRLGIEEKTIKKAFNSFQGISRRLDKKEERKSILVIDDYAHHPTEIHKTLAALRRALPCRRLIAVFQPHRPSRTKEHFQSYKTCFSGLVDELIVTDIYGAGENPIEGLDGQKLASSIESSKSLYLPRNHLAESVLEKLQPGDAVVTLGAGDITKMGSDLWALLENTAPKSLVVGVIEGGRSEEHEISLRSAQRIKKHLNPSLYIQKNFFIDPQGRWHYGDESGAPLSGAILDALQSCDVLFPVLHGPFGEDGTLQGLFEMLDKPYVGPDFRSAALCMDKALSKTVVQGASVPTLPFIAFERCSWELNSERLKEEIKGICGYPLYVKPVHLGSSVGIHRVDEEQNLQEALSHAFALDTKVLIERACIGARELEFAVIGNGEDSVEVPPPGEVFSSEVPYDYEGKYGKNPSRKDVVATLHPSVLHRGQEMAKRAYLALGCTGMTRVDFFLEPSGTFWFLEANPIPGMAEKSLFPRIWENKVGSSEALIHLLIRLALDRKRKTMQVM